MKITKLYPAFGCCRSSFQSRHVGWFFACQRARCSRYAYLQVGELALSATENRAPDIGASNNLWSYHGWVRGSWPISFDARDPSGVCDTAASLGSQVLQGPYAAPYRSTWQQCPNQYFLKQVDTDGVRGSGGVGEGDMTLGLWAMNAAGEVGSRSEVVHVDNQAPAVSLSGPASAPSTGGTQFVRASASAGPSGVAGIGCSLDGGPRQWHPGSSVSVPVAHVGVHRVNCVAYNNARDGSGAMGASAPADWTIAIKQPSVSTLTFARLAGRAHCVKARQRIRIPAQWVTVVVRGHRVRVKLRAQTRFVKHLKCQPRVAFRRVRRHGRWVMLPRVHHKRLKRIRFGSSVRVSGWVGTASGSALPGQQVRIFTAPNDGRGAFSIAATTISRGNGIWSAKLQAGPSRLVKAVYGGTNTIEPSSSAIARVIVPASVTMSVSSHRTHWGGTIVISGRVLGGYIPAAGELVVLKVRWRGGSTEIGHLYTKRDGTFSSTYTFLRGNGTETYRMWATTAAESDYPYVPARSRATTVTVGPG